MTDPNASMPAPPASAPPPSLPAPAPPPPPPPPPAGPAAASEAERLLDWAETAGIENMKDRHATLAMLRSEASTTLTVVLAGLGGTLTYAAKMVDPPAAGAVAFGAMILCAYFAVLAIVIVWKCLMVEAIPAVYNEPKNLVQAGFSLESIKEVEVKENLQVRIEEMVGVNDRLAGRLNTARVAAALSPVVFALAAGAYLPSSPAALPSVLKLQCKVVVAMPASAPTLACSMLPSG
jgi:hypothetical protein